MRFVFGIALLVAAEHALAAEPLPVVAQGVLWSGKTFLGGGAEFDIIVMNTGKKTISVPPNPIALTVTIKEGKDEREIMYCGIGSAPQDAYTKLMEGETYLWKVIVSDFDAPLGKTVDWQLDVSFNAGLDGKFQTYTTACSLKSIAIVATPNAHVSSQRDSDISMHKTKVIVKKSNGTTPAGANQLNPR